MLQYRYVFALLLLSCCLATSTLGQQVATPPAQVAGSEDKVAGSEGKAAAVIQDTVAQDTVAQDTVAQDTVAQDTVAQDTVAQDTALQATDARAEETIAAQPLQDLTADQYSAIAAAITQDHVAGTISFLASDELAGRGTPSKEFLIASAYVASRLRAAGARGLGPDGSFFLDDQVDVTRQPQSGIVFAQADGSPVQAVVLYGSPQVVHFQGSIALLDKVDDPLPDGLAGPIAIRLAEGTESAMPLPLQLDAITKRAQAAGATAVLVVKRMDDPVWKMAERKQFAPTLVSPRRRGPVLPVLLVNDAQFPSDGESSDGESSDGISGDGVSTEDAASSRQYFLHIPALIEETALVRNVAGVLEGRDETARQQALLFSAHLDHLGDFATGEDTVYNGADDDASGVAAVLTLADAFSGLKERPRRSVVFVTFWGEERGLLGSKRFAENSPWPLEDIVANINIEMIGRPEDGAENKMWMTGWNQSNLGQLVNEASRRIGVETFQHPSYSARLYRASDNYSLAQKGVIAHSFSAGSLHADYHQVTDEWQRLNLPHMTQVIRGIFAGVLPMANAARTPEAAQTPKG